MPTLPVGSSRDHIDRLRTTLAANLPGIRKVKLLFVNVRDSVLFFGVELSPLQAIESEETFSESLDRVIAERYQWVRIGGEGFLDEEHYLCTVDIAKEKSSPVTVIEVSGPKLDRQRAPVRSARVLIGFLEMVAQQLTKADAQLLGDRLLALYKKRSTGHWNHERLNEWKGEDVRSVAIAIESVMRTDSFSLLSQGPGGEARNRMISSELLRAVRHVAQQKTEAEK